MWSWSGKGRGGGGESVREEFAFAAAPSLALEILHFPVHRKFFAVGLEE